MDKSIKHKKLALGVVIAMGGFATVSGKAFSQDAVAAKQIDEIVVTATKRERSLQEIPVSVNAFGAEQLRKSRIQKIDDLEFLAAGMTVTDNKGATFVTIRGIGSNQTTGGTESGSSLHWDGVYIFSRYAQGNSFFDIERIEVLRGPQGTLSGRNATGGTVNVITKSPTKSLEYGGEMVVGNYNLFSTEGYVSGPVFNPDLTGRISFKTTNRDGYTDNIFNDEQYDDADDRAIRAKLNYISEDNIQFGLTLDYSKDSAIPVQVLSRLNPDIPFPSEDDSHVIPNGRVVNMDGPNYQRLESGGVLIDTKLNFGNTDLKSITAYRSHNMSSKFDIDGTTKPDQAFLFGTQGDQISQEFIWTNDAAENPNWTLGAFYMTAVEEQQVVIPLNNLGITIFDGISEAKLTTYAMFGDLSYSLSNKLSLSMGARYSYEEKSHDRYSGISLESLATVDREADWDSLTPRISLIYDFGEEISAYATISKGFKSGGFTGILAQIDPYEPEEVVNYEMGIKSILFERKVRANASIFYMDYKDLQVQQRITPAPGLPSVVSVTNAGKSTIQGVELEVEAIAAERLTLYANVSFLDAVYDEYIAVDSIRGNQDFDASGNQIIGAPKFSLSLASEYEATLGDWGTLILRGEYNHRSEVYFTPFEDQTRLHESVAQPEYDIVNGRISLIPQKTGWEISAFIQNATNESVFKHVIASSGLRRVEYGSPRTYGLSVRCDF